MGRKGIAITVLSLLALLLSGVHQASAVQASGTSNPHPTPSGLSAGHLLNAGDELVAANGAFTLRMQRNGNLVEFENKHKQREWATRTHGTGLVAQLRANGALVVMTPGRDVRWRSAPGGPRGNYRLFLGPAGGLAVRSESGRLVWSNKIGSRCTPGQPGRSIIVSISTQHLWACHHGELMQSTPVTTGAVSRGWVTPTGTWHVYRKQREVNLVGPSWNDHVHFWMPYSGPFGLHDASWQKFPEGSQKYKRHGSHGCVHVPLAEMHDLFMWARIGTRVSVRQ